MTQKSEYIPIDSRIGEEAWKGEIDWLYRRQKLLADTMEGGMVGGYLEEGFPFYFVDTPLLKWLGYESEAVFLQDIDGMVLNMVHPEDRDYVNRIVEQQLAVGGRYEVDYRMKKSDGSYIWVHDIGERMTAQDGRAAITSVCYDITREKEHDKLIDQLVGGLEARVGLYRVEEKRKLTLLHASENIMEVTHYSDEEYWEICKNDAIDFVYIPDREQVRNAVGRAMNEDVVVTEHFRLCDKKGGFTWITGVISRLGSDQGRPVARIIFMPFSIQSDLQMQMLDSKYMGVYVVDEETEELYYANNTIRSMFGVSDDLGIAGRTCHNVFFGRDTICEKCWRKMAGADKTVLQEYGGRVFSVEVQKRVWNNRNIVVAYSRDITEEIRLKTELMEEQSKKEMLMRGIPGGVAIYRAKTDGTFPADYVSEGLARSLGYTAEEFLAYLGADARCNLVPEDIPGVMEKVTEGIVNHTPISAVYRVYNKAHRPVRIRLDANIVETELKQDEAAVLYAVHTIVSEAAEAAIREQKLYRRLLDNMDMAYFESSEDGSFYASELYYQYAASQIDPARPVTNSDLLETVHTDDIPILLQFFDKKEKKELKVSATLRCRMTDGAYRWTELIGIYEYAPDGHPTRRIGVFRDAENEWVEQNRRLTEALETARQASRSKTEFFSRVSHDIRTPLNAILGFAHIAKDRPEQAGDYIAKIQSSGEYLLGLVNDVLDMSKIESESFEFHEDVVNARAFLEEIADMFAQVAAQSGVRLITDFSGTRNEWVHIDRLRLKQVYSNLLSNAIKFSAPETTVIWTVEHQMTEAGMDVVSVIHDEGCGMSEDFLQILFQPFSQEANPYSDKVTGTGLGLAIVKNLVNRMNGSIQVESKLGAGTTATLRFCRKLAKPPVSVLAQKQPDRKDVSLRGKRVLLCEDHPMNREIAVYLLKNCEIIVEEADDGQTGLEAFCNSPEGWFDGILMDIRMPKMSGIECTEKIRSLPRADAASIPIIAMTANAYAEDVQTVLDAGMNAHVAKPVDPKLLYEVLEKWL